MSDKVNKKKNKNKYNTRHKPADFDEDQKRSKAFKQRKQHLQEEELDDEYENYYTTKNM